MKTKTYLLLALFTLAVISLQGCRSQGLCPAYSDGMEEITEAPSPDNA